METEVRVGNGAPRSALDHFHLDGVSSEFCTSGKREIHGCHSKEPFVRIIHDEEKWLYANPRTVSYVKTSSLLWPMVVFVPLTAIALVHLLSSNGVILRDANVNADSLAAFLVVSLLMPLNGVVTNVLKLCVGRPRPDFLQR